VKRTPLKRKTELRRTDSLQRSAAKPGKSLRSSRRKPISPASPAQRAKVQGQPCLVCGREQSEWLAIDPAHVIPRSLGGCDDPACVVPLCRGFAGEGCHGDYDLGRVSLLPLLEPRWRVEQAHAVEHVGIGFAYDHTTRRETG
jgi:hypothetical protein